MKKSLPYSLITIIVIAFHLYFINNAYPSDKNPNTPMKLGIAAGLPAHWSFAITGGNATIVLNAGIPTLNGNPLPAGVYIGVFTATGLCCGHTQWNSENTAISAWANDWSGGINGFQPGETIYYRVYSEAQNKEWDDVNVSYVLGDGTYTLNKTYLLTAFNVTGETVPVELSNFIATYNNDVVLLQWSTESEIRNLGFFLDRCVKGRENWERITSYTTNNALKGKGTTSLLTQYEYLDKGVESGLTYLYRLTDVDLNGVQNQSKIIEATAGLKGEEESNQTKLPAKFELLSAFPNPFNPETTIGINLPKSSFVDLDVFNMRGEFIKSLACCSLNAGTHQFKWNGIDYNKVQQPSGIYFIRFSTGELVEISKVTLVR